MLQVNNLSVSYGEKEILKDVSFSLNKGKTVVIVGESGCGKTTLLRAILGILKVNGKINSGEIAWASDRRAMIFQNPVDSLDGVVRMGNQIYEMLRVYEKITKKEAKVRAKKCFDELGLPESIWSSYPFELSGGMCQRATIAMAYLSQADVILADEPTSALDVVSQKQTLEALKKVQRERQCALLIVTHNLGVASFMADEIMVMKQGRIVEHGSPKELFTHPMHPYTKKLIEAVPKMKD